MAKQTNRVTANGETILDLTGDTVTPENLDAGVKAHNAAGQAITGTGVRVTSVNDKAPDESGNVELTAADVDALSSAAGAVGTSNLGAGVVTREKLSAEVLGITSAGRSATPFDAECNGKLYIVAPSESLSFTLTSEVLAALPTGWAVTLVRGSVSGGHTYTLGWEADIPVLNGNDRKMSWSGAGSVSLNRAGDMVTITKWANLPRIIVMGNTNVRNIYAGTSATPPSTWQSGDIYLQYS